MKIKITSDKSGLKVGQEYDLCPTAAKTLILKSQATLVEEPAKVSAETKSKKAAGKN